MGKQLTSRQKQAIEMKEKIQETAMRLFNDKGFTAVSMENIAQEAGCSVGNIYNLSAPACGPISISQSASLRICVS